MCVCASNEDGEGRLGTAVQGKAWSTLSCEWYQCLPRMKTDRERRGLNNLELF